MKAIWNWKYYIGTGGLCAGNLYRKKLYYWEGYDTHKGIWVGLSDIFKSTSRLNKFAKTINSSSTIKFSRIELQRNTKRITESEAFLEMV